MHLLMQKEDPIPLTSASSKAAMGSGRQPDFPNLKFLMGVAALVVSSLAFSLNQEDNECDVIKRHDGALGESDHSACVDLCLVGTPGK